MIISCSCTPQISCPYPEYMALSFPCAPRADLQMTEWRNIAKTTVWFSSKMEKFMIQMTWPDDGVLDDIWVKVCIACKKMLSVRPAIMRMRIGIL